METNRFKEQRAEKQAKLRETGAEHNYCFTNDGNLARVRAQFHEGKFVAAAGRIVSLRSMGKSAFIDIQDVTGKMQVFLSARDLQPEDAEAMKLLDLGDFIGVSGDYILSKTGEMTIKPSRLRVLNKSLLPIPSAFFGLQNEEARQRQRYLDLIANEETRKTFLLRAQMIQKIRQRLTEKDFIEVETPMLTAVASGAAAKPFVTRHNSLGLDLNLRIAPELYLKQLLVGGFTRIFELNRNFRNEGLSRRHNPEFTMLESYEAYADYVDMMIMMENLIASVDFRGKFLYPFASKKFYDLVSRDQTPAQAMEQFEKEVQPTFIQPTFVTHFPKELVPLAKQNVDDPATVDVFELIINGMEVGCGYSELNDSVVQRQRLIEQAGDEQVVLDEEFLTALEYGMPPAGGLGLGIDRLVMVMSGAESIRDVIMFPQLR